MKDAQEIGKIILEIDGAQIKRIAARGQLEAFVEKASALFARDLKANLVEEGVSSLSTGLFLFDDDEFGTGPRPPIWHLIESVEKLTRKIQVLEKALDVQADVTG